MAQGGNWDWGGPGHGHGPERHRPARSRGSIYRSAAATGDPEATLVIPPIFDIPSIPVGGGPPRYGTPVGQAAPPGYPAPPERTTDLREEAEGASAASNSAVMAIGSLVSRLTGFLRTAVLAAALGGSLVGDSYTTAQFFPGMIYEFLLGGILGDFIVPVLVRARKSDPDRGQAYAQRLLTLAVVALGAATVLAVLAAPLLAAIYSGDAPDAKRHVITVLSYLIMPTIFFYGLSAISGAILYSRGHFAAPMWTPILNNMVVIATGGLYLLLFGAKPIRPEDITGAQLAVIGGGTLFGIVVQSIGLWPALRRVGFRWRWRFDFRALGLRELGRLGIWMFCYVAVSQIGVLVLLNLLNRANDNGNVAGPMIYNNVYLLLMMAHGIVAVSIITALLPRMSAAAHERRFGDVAADLSRGTRTSAAVLAPIAVCYVVLAQPAMITLFERGAFTRGQAIDGAGVLVIAGFALIPFAISQLVTFAFYALADTKTPAVTNLPVVGTRILIQVGVFMAFAASFTATGLMLGNAISYVLAVGLAVMLLRPRVGRLGARAIVATLFKVAAAGLGAGLVGWLVLKMLPIGDDVTRLEAAVQLMVGAGAVLVTYLVLSVVLRIREIKEVLDLVRRRLSRR
jgi:putative peptidoglycan lipid II flippase